MSILYLVATPIGNREDISQRALRILDEVSIIYAEDTRHSRQLLNNYGIKAELRSLHQHNENARIDEVIEQLNNGKNLALISDAGLPLISDPGENLVKVVRLNTQHQIVPIPGPSAVLTALVASGLRSHPFTFCGFLPDKKGQREKILKEYSLLPHTLIFFVAIHDLKKYLHEIVSLFQTQTVVVGRELTKMHESFYSGTATELLASKLAKIIAKLTNTKRQDVYAILQNRK